MRVYTHYTKITEKEGFRWRTLLQFGDSWNIIGTVVMKNPGSASVSCPVTDTEVLQALRILTNTLPKKYGMNLSQIKLCIASGIYFMNTIL